MLNFRLREFLLKCLYFALKHSQNNGKFDCIFEYEQFLVNQKHTVQPEYRIYDSLKCYFQRINCLIVDRSKDIKS